MPVNDQMMQRCARDCAAKAVASCMADTIEIDDRLMAAQRRLAAACEQDQCLARQLNQAIDVCRTELSDELVRLHESCGTCPSYREHDLPQHEDRSALLAR